MKYITTITLLLFVFTYSCSSNKNKQEEKLSPQDSIYIENKKKPFSERTPIPYYSSERDSTMKGSFSVSEDYWADVVYYKNKDELEIYINDKLSNSLIDPDYESVFFLTQGYSLSAKDENGFTSLYFDAMNFSYCHHFVAEEERFVPRVEEEIIIEEKIVYKSIANTIGVLEYDWGPT